MSTQKLLWRFGTNSYARVRICRDDRGGTVRYVGRARRVADLTQAEYEALVLWGAVVVGPDEFEATT